MSQCGTKYVKARIINVVVVKIKRLKRTKVCHFVFHVMQVGKPFRFHTPSSILVVGPSGCGKTVFTEKTLVREQGLV